jgi:hypothetical protein
MGDCALADPTRKRKSNKHAIVPKRTRRKRRDPDAIGRSFAIPNARKLMLGGGCGRQPAPKVVNPRFKATELYGLKEKMPKRFGTRRYLIKTPFARLLFFEYRERRPGPAALRERAFKSLDSKNLSGVRCEPTTDRIVSIFLDAVCS